MPIGRPVTTTRRWKTMVRRCKDGCTSARRWRRARWTWLAIVLTQAGDREQKGDGGLFHMRHKKKTPVPFLVLLLAVFAAASLRSAQGRTPVSSSAFFSTRLPPGLPTPL